MVGGKIKVPERGVGAWNGWVKKVEKGGEGVGMNKKSS